MRNLILIFLLLPFIFAGSFQSYTEKTTPEASDIFLILDNDDLTTKKVQVGNIGDGINWDSVNIQAGGINWTSLDQDIQKSGVNWSSLDDSIQASGINWESLNQDIQYEGINWTSANMSNGGASGNVGVGTLSPSYRFVVHDTNNSTATTASRELRRSSALTTGVTFLDRQVLDTSGTAGDSFGFLNSFILEAADGTELTAWREGYQWTDATAKDAEHRLIITKGGTPTTKWVYTSDGEIGFNTSATTGNIDSIVDIYGAGSSGATKAFQVRNSGATSKVVILDNGNVGIGTINPSNSLIVSTGNVGIGTLFPEGKFVVRTTSDIGWTSKTGANTACNTTCVSGCVAGLDNGSPTFLLCTDATADSCLCSGSD